MEKEFENKARECKIRLSSRHIVHNIERFARYGVSPSLFGKNEQLHDENNIDPEDFPDEMSDALDEILRIEHEKYGSPECVTDPFAPDDEDDDSDDFDIDPNEPIPSVEQLNQKLDQLMRLLNADNEEDDGTLIFETRGTIVNTIRDGREVTEVTYTEDESMDGTETVIRFDPKKPRSVTISHTGGVISTLVCDEGVRHITVYNTPLMPFEIAVYTKRCRGILTSFGGKIELDYMLELRGADLQRTIMTIEISAL